MMGDWYLMLPSGLLVAVGNHLLALALAKWKVTTGAEADTEAEVVVILLLVVIIVVIIITIIIIIYHHHRPLRPVRAGAGDDDFAVVWPLVVRAWRPWRGWGGRCSSASW
jgi:heme/copper-type cytochrome/quinol oxidase subunit 2